MSINQDTAFDRIPAASRGYALGREKADLAQTHGSARSSGRRTYRFLGIGTQGPLAAIAPSPPRALDAHYESDQGALSEYVKNAIRAMWDAHIDPDRFSASWKDMGPILKILIAQAFAGSAGNAAEYYRNLHVV